MPGVDIWYARTDRCPYAPLRDAFLRVLSPEERECHAGFVRDADRHIYLLAHALLRLALSDHRGGPAERWTIAPAPGGKPRVVEALEFNLSHTTTPGLGGVAACAVSRAGPVGIDVEPVTRAPELTEIVAHRFAPEERRMLAALPALRRGERTVWMWTAKEAILKATGAGLAGALDAITIAWDADDRPRAAGWHLLRFRIDGEWLGTVATSEPPGPVRVVCREGGALDAAPASAFELLQAAR